MKLHVRYFAALRDRRGVGEEDLEFEGGTVGELVASLELGLPVSLVRAAVDGTFVEHGHCLAGGEVVVLLPPVAGG